MAVEYEISSDVATIKDVAPNTQVARVVSLYSGQITYDDEAGSKFATATIDGKSQRVMLCIAVNGTVNYDDVPCLYSTVDGHRCLNIVAPTETGTPDDVPSVYETVVIDGKNVRAVRCILINATPIYDGVSSTCTFVENGKTHTAQLVNKITGGSVEIIVRGSEYIALPDAIANSLAYLKAFGGTEQRNIPQPYTQVNYVTNTAQTAVDTGIMIDFAKNYEFEVECRAVSGSWYILQSRASSSGNITGIHGATSGSTITLVVGNVTVCTSAITRTVGNKLYVKATLNNGTATLYVKDETANTEDTQTGSYGTSQPNPTASVYLLGNAGGQYVDVNSDIYMARIKENGTVVMDYMPARQVATAGFYDTVSGTFKTALTPANLSADGNTVPSPDTPMDIVSNNGALKLNTSATGYSTQTGTPTPTDPIDIVSYKQGDLILRGIGDYKDTYDATTGTITRNVGVKVFDGTENWFAYGGGAGYQTTVQDMLSSTSGAYFCTHAIAVSGITSRGIRFGAGNKILYWCQINTMFTTLDMFKTWLADQYAAGTPVIIYYPLETPTTEHYVGVYADGTVETINVHGKNLFDEQYESGIYSTTTGEKSPSNNRIRSVDLIRVLPSTTYIISSSDDAAVLNVCVVQFDINGQFLRSTIVSGGKFTVGTGCCYIGIYFATNYTVETAPSWVQLEQGSTATTYEPYFNGGTATAEMLLKVGDYQDVQSIIDGVVTRNVGVKVFDGTENWVRGTAIYTQGLNLGAYNGEYTAICSHFQAVSNSQQGSGLANTNKMCIGNYEHTAVYKDSIYIYGTTTDFPDVTTWTNWLKAQYNAGTPVVVVYPLATPTTESVAGQTMQVQQGDNIVEITQASLDNLELEAKYQAAVSLTIQEVQDANLDPNVQVTIN